METAKGFDQKILCKQNYIMEDGTVAFKEGHEYKWRWATKDEKDKYKVDVSPIYVFINESNDHHFMNYSDVEEAFL